MYPCLNDTSVLLESFADKNRLRGVHLLELLMYFSGTTLVNPTCKNKIPSTIKIVKVELFNETFYDKQKNVWSE